MSKLNPVIFFVKYFWYIVFVLVVVLILISYLGFAKPKLDLLKSGGPLDDGPYLEIIKQQESYLKNLSFLVNRVNDLDLVRLEKIDQLISAKCDILDLLKTIDMITKMTERYNFSIDRIGYRIEPGEVVVDLVIGGQNYTTFKNFLREIESSVRLIDLKSLSFSFSRGVYGLQLVVYCLE